MTQHLTADDFEALGLLVDKLDNGVSATVLPLPPHIRIIGMKGIMEDARDELRAFLVGKGFNPWSNQ